MMNEITVREQIKLGSEYFLSQQFTETDQLDLPAEASAQAGATIKRNLPACRSLGAGREVLGYGE
jgi:hypothetical protein